MGGKKQRVSLRDIPMTRAQVIMRDDIQRPKTVKEPKAKDVGTCPTCGDLVYAFEVSEGLSQWCHDPNGKVGQRDNHIPSYASVIRKIGAPLDQAVRDAGLVDGPMKLGQVLDETFAYGITAEQVSKLDRDQAVTDIALEVINEGPRLQLDLNQWAVVQQLVELAVRAGSDAEQQGRI